MALLLKIRIGVLWALAFPSNAFLPCPIHTRLSAFSSSTHLNTFSSSEDNTPLDPFADDDEERLSDEELMATCSDWDPTVPAFNTIHLTGRVGNDPMPKYFEDGKVVVNLSLASRRKYHSMERAVNNIPWGQEETDWYGLEIWGPTAEFVAKFVDKGMRVGVIGSLQEDKWTNKETNEPRNAWKVIVRDFDILESKAEAEGRRQGRGGGGNSNYNNRRSSNSGSGGYFSTSEDSYGGESDGPSSAGTGGFFDSY